MNGGKRSSKSNVILYPLLFQAECTNVTLQALAGSVNKATAG